MKVRLKFSDFRYFSMNDAYKISYNDQFVPDMTPYVILGNKRGPLNKIYLAAGEKLIVDHDNIAAIESKMCVQLDNNNRMQIEGPGYLVLRKNKSNK